MCTERPYGVAIWNVIATKPGVLYPDSVIIIGGHYDSIVYDGTDPFVWAPGADDNASGAVGVLEAARILASVDLDCTVKFASLMSQQLASATFVILIRHWVVGTLGIFQM